MNIAIIGLGLIGGSLGRAIVKKTEHQVFGRDIDPSVMLKAELLQAFHKELNDTNKPYYLYQLWTAKEALIKMIGGSVTMDMKLIDTDLQLGRMTYNDEIYLLKQHMNERYVMSLVSKKTVDYTWHDVTETSLLDIY